MLFRLLIILFAVLANDANAQQTILNDDYYTKHQIDALKSAEDEFSFLVLGDWGRNGHFFQRDVATWLDVASRQLDARFIATTGDNFYDNGVASVDDPYWHSSFEAIYSQPHLFIDWYPVLGNHDYRGNWQAQIDYSQKSRRWQMPSQYYSKHITLDDGTRVLVAFIDTSPLNPAYDDRPKYAKARSQGQKEQLAWLNATLKESNANWKLVIGHHPLYSSGKRHGRTHEIRNILEPIMETHGVDAYFAGHEHDLQHNQAQGKSVAHFVSGGGSEVRPVGQYAFTRFAKSTGGFAAVTINNHELQVRFIDHHGQVIYQYSLSQDK